MKVIGLIGGMSWESTALYYRIINNEVKAALGGLHSAKIALYSFDFAEIAALQKAGDWKQATQKMIAAAQAVKAAGAEAIVICTNTMHVMAEEVQAAVQVPLIHIADCTGEVIRSKGLRQIGLLGTQFTMEKPFYRERLEQRYGIEILLPNEPQRSQVHSVIFEELCRGIVSPASRSAYETIIADFKARGAEGVILGCTEIVMLLGHDPIAGLPLFDTTYIHAVSAAQFALQDVQPQKALA